MNNFARLYSGDCMLSKPDLRRLGFEFRDFLTQISPKPNTLLALLKAAAEYPFGVRTFNALLHLSPPEFREFYLSLKYESCRRKGKPVLEIKVPNPFLNRVSFAALRKFNSPERKVSSILQEEIRCSLDPKDQNGVSLLALSLNPIGTLIRALEASIPLHIYPPSMVAYYNFRILAATPTEILPQKRLNRQGTKERGPSRKYKDLPISAAML